MLAIFGTFVGSIVVIAVLNKEIDAIIITIGVMGELSDSFLGISVLTWSACLGDLVACIGLARSGRAQLAFISCFGTQMFSMYMKTPYWISLISIYVCLKTFFRHIILIGGSFRSETSTYIRPHSCGKLQPFKCYNSSIWL